MGAMNLRDHSTSIRDYIYRREDLMIVLPTGYQPARIVSRTSFWKHVKCAKEPETLQRAAAGSISIKAWDDYENSTVSE